VAEGLLPQEHLRTFRNGPLHPILATQETKNLLGMLRLDMAFDPCTKFWMGCSEAARAELAANKDVEPISFLPLKGLVPR
jgi:hypothetical protein